MNDEATTLRKFLDNLPSKPCKTRPEPRLCRICVRLNKKVALRCPFSGIKLEKVMFEEPRIEVIRPKEKIPVLQPLAPPPPEPWPAQAVKPIPAPPPEAIPILEPIPAVPKMEKRLTELKILRRKKISILIGVVPIVFGIILAGLGAYLYNTIKDYPSSPAPYNISILAGGFWIIAGLILTIISGISKKEFLHALCVILGTLGLIAGVVFIGFGYRLYLITETLSGVEPYYTAYNISAFIGISSIIIFLIVLLYGLLSKK